MLHVLSMIPRISCYVSWMFPGKIMEMSWKVYAKILEKIIEIPRIVLEMYWTCLKSPQKSLNSPETFLEMSWKYPGYTLVVEYTIWNYFERYYVTIWKLK